MVDPPAGLQTNGEAARLFVRPNELEIYTEHGERSGIRATVARVQPADPMVKVELTREGGQTVFVKLAHDRFRSDPFAVGDLVFVAPRDARIFV